MTEKQRRELADNRYSWKLFGEFGPVIQEEFVFRDLYFRRVCVMETDQDWKESYRKGKPVFKSEYRVRGLYNVVPGKEWPVEYHPVSKTEMLKMMHDADQEADSPRDTA